MKIDTFVSYEDQMARLNKHHFSVARLVELSKNFKVMTIPLDHLNVYNIYSDLTLRDMAMHFNAVNNADLKYPIILDEDGEIMDGRHRIIKAMIEGKRSIKAVRFDKNPEPCKVDKN